MALASGFDHVGTESTAFFGLSVDLRAAFWGKDPVWGGDDVLDAFEVAPAFLQDLHEVTLALQIGALNAFHVYPDERGAAYRQVVEAGKDPQRRSK